MDRRFPLWMHLQLESLEGTKKVIQYIQNFFDRKLITLSHFENDKILLKQIKKIINQNRDLEEYLSPEQVKEAQPQQNQNGREDMEGFDGLGNIKVSTITKYIETIVFYAKFLGRSFDLSIGFAKKLSLNSKYLQHGAISLQIQDNLNSRLLLVHICDQLKKRQVVIDERINRWLHFGCMAESTESLNRFGLHELQPFLELCLRFMVLPMLPGRLTALRITLDTIPSEIDTLFQTEVIRNMFPEQDSTKPGDAIFLNGDHFTHVSVAYATRTGKKQVEGGKLISRDISQTLSVYIYFFIKFCKGNPNLIGRREKRIRESNLLFSQIKGGYWKYLKRDVRDYALQLDMKVEEMGLGKTQNTTSYLHLSRIAWVAARSSFSDLGHTRLGTDTRSVKLGIGNETKYSTGLSSIRELQRARNSLSVDSDILYSNVVPQLYPINSTHCLYPLLVELSKKRQPKPKKKKLKSTSIPIEGWTDIFEDNSLFSVEYKKEFRGQQKSARDFQSAREKQNNKVKNMSLLPKRVTRLTSKKSKSMTSSSSSRI
jgi:hypothetical protein